MGFRVAFFTVGDIHFASSRTRVFQYFPLLKEAGVKTSVMTDTKLRWLSRFTKPMETRWHRFSQRLAFLLVAPFHDVVFIQKIIFPPWYINILTFLNPRLAFDLDDAIYTTSGVKEVDNSSLNHLLTKARAVFAENEEVIDYVHQFNSTVYNILGPIDCQRYRPRLAPRRPGPVTIGWVGSPSTEKYLFLVREAFAALDPASYRFVVIGVRPDFAQRWELPVDARPWTIDTEVSILEEFDLGIMPLPDDRWSRGKGGYKLLQYMAMGLPSVTSPIGVNVELVEEAVTGRLATNQGEWVAAFQALIASQGDRERMGKEARRRAVDRYSFEHHFPTWIAGLEKCGGRER